MGKEIGGKGQSFTNRKLAGGTGEKEVEEVKEVKELKESERIFQAMWRPVLLARIGRAILLPGSTG